jgi:hypothetical protein
MDHSQHNRNVNFIRSIFANEMVQDAVIRNIEIIGKDSAPHSPLPRVGEGKVGEGTAAYSPLPQAGEGPGERVQLICCVPVKITALPC